MELGPHASFPHPLLAFTPTPVRAARSHGACLDDRGILFTLAGLDANYATLSAHQVIADGWSLAVAMHEASHLYRAHTTGKPPELPALKIQYRDYALWQRAWMSSPARLPHLRYWHEQLADLACSPFPHDLQPSGRTLRAGVIPIAFTDAISDGINACAAQENVSPFMILLASLNVLVRELTGDASAAIGIPVANRSRRETHQLIGPFSHFLTVQTDVSDNPTFQDLLQRSRETTAQALAHQELLLIMYFHEVRAPNSKPIAASSAIKRLANVPILYTAILALQPPMPTFHLGDASLEPVELYRSHTLGGFHIMLWNETPRMRGRVEYGKDFFLETTVESMAARWMEIMSRGCSDPTKRISRL